MGFGEFVEFDEFHSSPVMTKKIQLVRSTCTAVP